MNGKDLLSKILSSTHNVDLVDKYMRTATSSDDEYADLVYEISTELLTLANKKHTIQQILKRLKQNQIGWNHPKFQPYIDRASEEDSFLTSPLEIEEGVLECQCGSKRTISFQRQTRSADEGCTTFAQCVECGKKWRHNN